MNTAARQALVVKFLHLADFFAWEKARQTPICVTIDELKSAAYMGLVQAAASATSADSFYPHARIKGEILDYLRTLSWGKRGSALKGVCTDFSEGDYGDDKYHCRGGILSARAA